VQRLKLVAELTHQIRSLSLEQQQSEKALHFQKRNQMAQKQPA
jgi:hypothetical protein